MEYVNFVEWMQMQCTWSGDLMKDKLNTGTLLEIWKLQLVDFGRGENRFQIG